VARASGNWTLPEIRVPWWNTETNALQYATLPARAVTVRSTNTTDLPSDAPIPTPGSNQQGAAPTWLWALAGSGWLVAALLLGVLIMGRPKTATSPAKRSTGPSETSVRQAMVRVRRALEQQDSSALRQAVLLWGSGHHGKGFSSLTELANASGEHLAAVLKDLDRALYSPGSENAASEKLISALRNEPAPEKGSNGDTPLTLYPTG